MNLNLNVPLGYHDNFPFKISDCLGDRYVSIHEGTALSVRPVFDASLSYVLCEFTNHTQAARKIMNVLSQSDLERNRARRHCQSRRSFKPKESF